MGFSNNLKGKNEKDKTPLLHGSKTDSKIKGGPWKFLKGHCVNSINDKNGYYGYYQSRFLKPKEIGKIILRAPTTESPIKTAIEEPIISEAHPLTKTVDSAIISSTPTVSSAKIAGQGVNIHIHVYPNKESTTEKQQRETATNKNQLQFEATATKKPKDLTQIHQFPNPNFGYPGYNIHYLNTINPSSIDLFLEENKKKLPLSTTEEKNPHAATVTTSRPKDFNQISEFPEPYYNNPVQNIDYLNSIYPSVSELFLEENKKENLLSTQEEKNPQMGITTTNKPKNFVGIQEFPQQNYHYPGQNIDHLSTLYPSHSEHLDLNKKESISATAEEKKPIDTTPTTKRPKGFGEIDEFLQPSYSYPGHNIPYLNPLYPSHSQHLFDINKKQPLLSTAEEKNPLGINFDQPKDFDQLHQFPEPNYYYPAQNIQVPNIIYPSTFESLPYIDRLPPKYFQYPRPHPLQQIEYDEWIPNKFAPSPYPQYIYRHSFNKYYEGY
ncbi:uncharacterized protein LOC136025370 isoform X2 [Artemia franciscana]|uniref:uncharacterized protein LOC136025370 isoform X2 n=1 Tax=Artemia franciscana TaxID=6661 RepID=UPI0032DAF927